MLPDVINWYIQKDKAEAWATWKGRRQYQIEYLDAGINDTIFLKLNLFAQIEQDIIYIYITLWPMGFGILEIKPSALELYAMYVGKPQQRPDLKKATHTVTWPI